MKIFAHCILLTAALCAVNVHGQTDVIVPGQGSPVADGTMIPGEWDFNYAVFVHFGMNDSCRVVLAVDDQALYLAFVGPIDGANTVFPEVLLDIAHDRSVEWDADDHWFHVSANACHHQGIYGIFDDCQEVPDNWSAHPLITSGTPITNRIEVAIPWSYLGIVPEPGDTIGFAAVLTNTVDAWNYWPAGADRDSPGTWGHLVFPAANGITEGQQVRSLRIWPSPSEGRFNVAWDPALGAAHRLRISDAAGRVVKDERGSFLSGHTVDMYGSGMFQVTIEFGNGDRVHGTLIAR